MLTRGVDCAADARATRTYIESRSFKKLFYAPSVRHWVRQGMIGNFCSHCGRRPKCNFLREMSFAVYQSGCKGGAKGVSCDRCLSVWGAEGRHIKRAERFRVDGDIPNL